MESARFDGSFVADSMAESLMILGNSLDDSKTDNALCVKKRESERDTGDPSIYMRWNVRGKTGRFPIGNKESRRCRNRTSEDKHVVNEYEQEEHSCLSRSDCISPIGERDKDNDDDNHDLKQRFFLSMISNTGGR